MAAGPHGYPQSLVAGQPDAGHEIGVVGGEQDGGRETAWPAGVEDPADPGVLIPGLAPAEEPAGESVLSQWRMTLHPRGCWPR